MNISDILKNIGQIAAEVQLAETLAGHTNVTINDIAGGFNAIVGAEENVRAGKAVKAIAFTETEGGAPAKIKLYAVLDGGHADQVISSTLV